MNYELRMRMLKIAGDSEDKDEGKKKKKTLTSGIESPGMLGNYFVPSILGGQNEALSAASGVDPDNSGFTTKHPYWTQAGITVGGGLGGGTLGAVGGAGIARILAGLAEMDDEDKNLVTAQGATVGAGLGGFLGAVGGSVAGAGMRRAKNEELRSAVDSQGVDKKMLLKLIANRHPGVVKAILASLVGYPYGSHTANEADTASRLLGQPGAPGVQTVPKVTAGASLVPYLGALAQPIGQGIQGSTAKDLRRQMAIGNREG